MAPPGRTRCRNGEVWTSPCRESPRLPLRSQRSGGTSSPKADGLYKSCWRIAAPHGATLDTGPGSVGASGAQRARCTLRPSRLRATGAQGGPVTRALPCSRALTRQPAIQTGAAGERKKENLFSENRSGKRVGTQTAAAGSSCRKGGGKPGAAGCVPLPQPKTGFFHFLGKTLQNHKKLDKIDSTNGTSVPEKGEKKWTYGGQSTHLRRRQKQLRQPEQLP